MQKYLFQGKRKDNGEWIEGNYVFEIQSECGTDICIANGAIGANDYSEILGDYYEVVAETVRLYTNFKDKNGRKIFVGDIIRISKFLYVVTLDAIGAFLCHSDNDKTIFNDMLLSDWKTEDIEVVGNTEDNPELLNKQNTVEI